MPKRQTTVQNYRPKHVMYLDEVNPSAFSFMVDSLTNGSFSFEKIVVRPTEVKPVSIKARILEAAMQYFSTKGFEGNTRDLAKELGLTQAAIFKHFKNKEDLYKQAYETAVKNLWKDEWSVLLADESIRLEDRWLAFRKQFYDDEYFIAIIRLHALELRASALDKTVYRSMIREKLVGPICRSLRKLCGVSFVDAPITEEETAYILHVHGSFYAQALQTQLFGTLTLVNPAITAKALIHSFVAGSKEYYKTLVLPTHKLCG